MKKHTVYRRLTSQMVRLSAFVVLISAASCSKETPGPLPGGGDEVSNTEINTWVTDNMRDVYYWNTSIPSNGSLDFKKEPLEFFKTILYSEDRFSWLQDADDLDDGLSGVSTSVGLGITLIGIQNSQSVFLTVRYSLKGSPAHAAGIKRGDLITQINNQSLTRDNYGSLLNIYYGEAPFTVQIANIEGTTIVNDRQVSLTPVQRFQEHAVHLDTVITTPSGKKVGYLFYNRFLNEQINELLQVFNRFKQAQVDELILDLRYNGGGGIFISGVLSGLIHKNFNEQDIFISYKWNNNYRDDDYSYYRLFGGNSNNSAEKLNADQIVTNMKSLNLGLDRVFVLATGNTASASELVINNLRPFMSSANVIQIGEKTVGKNQGSITIKDERTPQRIKWGIQPIVVLLANRDGHGDYPNGLLPTLPAVNENQYLPYSPLASFDDPLFNQAIKVIDPSVVSVVSGMQMNLRAQGTRALNAKEIADFQDRANLPRPVDLGQTVDF